MAYIFTRQPQWELASFFPQQASGMGTISFEIYIQSIFHSQFLVIGGHHRRPDLGG